MEFFTHQLGPFPVWVWIVVVVGGVALYFAIKHFTGANASNTSAHGETTAANPFNPSNDPNIDPNTGVPYSLEEMVDPNTGIPFYFETTFGSNPNNAGIPRQGPGEDHDADDKKKKPPVKRPPNDHDADDKHRPGGPHNPRDPGGPIKPPIPTPHNPADPGGGFLGPPVRNPPTPARYQTVNVKPWPNKDSSLYSIWQGYGHGVPWEKWESEVLKMNPAIDDPDLIYPNENIKVPA